MIQHCRQSHLRQRVDHLWSQIQPGGSPAAERTVVASWPRLKTTMIVDQINLIKKKPGARSPSLHREPRWQAGRRSLPQTEWKVDCKFENVTLML